MSHDKENAIDSRHLAKIYTALIDCGETFDSDELFPTVIPEAAPFVVSDPYAFAIAACLDRGMKAEIAWTIPYDIKKRLGHLDPFRIYKMTLEELTNLFARLPRRPRYINDAPRTLQELTRIVVEECGGDASRIWVGKRAAEVKRTFQSIHGVGPGIANMAVLLIEMAFPVRFDDLDRRNMDIKADVHTMRVQYRLGVSSSITEQAAIDAARRLSPEYPGAVDGALWNIGRTWCHASEPDCTNCCMDAVCAKRQVFAQGREFSFLSVPKDKEPTMPSDYPDDPKLTYALIKLEDELKAQRENPHPDYDHITKNRDKALVRYQPIFHPSHIPALTKAEFESFLLYKNNHHWDSLHRVGKYMTADMPLLRRALAILVDESRPVRERLNRIRPERYFGQNSMVSHLGTPVLTAILLVVYPEKYGVWNNTSDEGLHIVQLWDPRWEGDPAGDVYEEMNQIYQELSQGLNIDLWTLDALWWVLKKKAQ